MAGAVQVAGVYHRLIPAISSNYGYLALLVAMLSGCATFRSYDKELGQALDHVAGGNVDGAIRVLESNNKSKNKTKIRIRKTIKKIKKTARTKSNRFFDLPACSSL